MSDEDLGAVLGDMDEPEAKVKPLVKPTAKVKLTPGKNRSKVKTKSVKDLGLTRIILEENENIPPTGLFLGVNGRGYLVQTGVEVDVNASVLDNLNHAEMDTPVLNPQTKQVIGYRKRLRYPYRVVPTK